MVQREELSTSQLFISGRLSPEDRYSWFSKSRFQGFQKPPAASSIVFGLEPLRSRSRIDSAEAKAGVSQNEKAGSSSARQDKREAQWNCSDQRKRKKQCACPRGPKH